MLIIAGHIEVDPDRRDAAVDAMQELVERARAQPGCLDLSISADRLDPARINNFERWESDDALAAWRGVAAPPDMGAEIRADHVERYDISGVRDPFD